MACWGGGGGPGLGLSSCTISIASSNLLYHSHHHAHTLRFLQLHQQQQQQRHVIYYANNNNNILVYHNNNTPSTRRRRRWRFMALGSASDATQDNNNNTTPAAAAAAGFCIIEGPETVQDFAKMELQEIHDNVRSRRNKIFLHMEEVRRLRIQQRIKSAELRILNDQQENELPNFPSFIPFLPPLTSSNLKQYYVTCYSLIAGIILFGGLLAPTLELRLGLGGTSYADFIQNMHLPMQLSQVDPIVASFSGGAVGVISALMVVEINNVKLQEQKRCKYCLGAGYLACARCSSTGAIALIEPVSTFSGENQPLSPPKTERCSNCSGSGKVMCPTCLCTGMAMASEHDPRIDPFD